MGALLALWDESHWSLQRDDGDGDHAHRGAQRAALSLLWKVDEPRVREETGQPGIGLGGFLVCPLHLSIYLSVWSVCLSVCLYVYLNVYICICVYI